MEKEKQEGRVGREECQESKGGKEEEKRSRETLKYLVQDSKTLDLGAGMGVGQNRVSMSM